MGVNVAPVTMKRAKGLAMLIAAIQEVTGAPPELQRKAEECLRAAAHVGEAADDTDSTIKGLAQHWTGQAYNDCHTTSARLTGELRDILKRGLEQEANRLNTSATALEKAKSDMEQQKQSFDQSAQQIIASMMSAIAKALPQNVPAAEAAVQTALTSMSNLLSSKKNAAEGIKTTLSNLLSGLYTTGEGKK